MRVGCRCASVGYELKLMSEPSGPMTITKLPTEAIIRINECGVLSVRRRFRNDAERRIVVRDGLWYIRSL